MSCRSRTHANWVGTSGATVTLRTYGRATEIRTRKTGVGDQYDTVSSSPYSGNPGFEPAKRLCCHRHAPNIWPPFGRHVYLSPHAGNRTLFLQAELGMPSLTISRGWWEVAESNCAPKRVGYSHLTPSRG